jgi:DNA mismatch repair protein MutL
VGGFASAAFPAKGTRSGHAAKARGRLVGLIQQLPDEVVDKIAAGEVVERPASVVKELAENAIDAAARSISIEIEAGGKSLIRVRDDGSGMPPEDARLSLCRHATSKLRSAADLDAIASLGFRGEALSSIASVSHLLLTTREEGSAAGTRVECRHGRDLEVREAGHPRGTTVEVRDLFGAVPARRKFLRADSTETAHVAEVVTLLALAHPELGFRLASRGQAILEAPPVEGLRPRVYQLFGSAYLERLAEVAATCEWVGVRGFVARIDGARGVRARFQLRLFVNGRPVRDRALSKAVSEAYRRAGVRDPRPEGLLFVEAPLHFVDVNVHPAKSEVRFADAKRVFDAVVHTVAQGLGGAASAGDAGGEPRAERVREAVSLYEARLYSREPREDVAPPRSGAAPAAASFGAAVGTANSEADAGAVPIFPDAGASVLGQHRNTYIVATDGDELLLVDQHTAHERVRFEEIMGRLERRASPAQRLLTPALVTLPPRLRPCLSENQEGLAALGFEVEAFGGDALRVSAVPEPLGTRDPGPALLDLLTDLLERETGDFIVQGNRARLAATLACHSAVRAGQPLSLEQMRAVVRDLDRAAQPGVCPHGRPTRVRVPREDVSRWFGRSGWRRQ